MTAAGDPPVVDFDKTERLSLLDTFVPAESAKQEQERQSFHQRLVTFTPRQYFCKPNSLSPIVVARFGWKNAASDMLVCDHCQAAWAVVFRPGLTASATQHLTRLYETQLSKAHAESCYFGEEAAQYNLDHAATTAGVTEKDAVLDCLEPIVPTLLARVFPADLMHVLEHPNPQALLGDQWGKLLAAIASRTETEEGFVFPNMPVPASVSNYCASKDPADSLETSLLAKLVTIFQKTDLSTTMLSNSTAESAAALVLLGWIPRQETVVVIDANPNSTMALECPICLARMQVSLALPQHQPRSSSAESPPPRKRPRPQTLDPVEMHRHYCPYVCGFPAHGNTRATPIWKILASRLVAGSMGGPTITAATADTPRDDAWIRNILQSAVSPRGTHKGRPSIPLEPTAGEASS
jgi:hypothetical protein